MTPASHRILSILPARPLDRRQARRPTLCLLRVVVVVLSGHLRLLLLGLETSAWYSRVPVYRVSGSDVAPVVFTPAAP